MKKTITLDENEIKYLFEFVKSKYVRFIDVQHELVDHLASAIEEEMEHDEKLSFEQALSDIYSRFPITGFAQIVTAKEKALSKYWWKKTIKYLLEFLSFPKIVLTCVIFFMINEAITRFGNYSLIALVVLLFIFNILLSIKYKKLFRNIDKKHNYLFLNAFEGSCRIVNFFSLYLLFQLLINPARQFSFIPTYIISALFSILFIYNYASYFAFPKMLKDEVNRKYRHLGLSFA